MSSVHEAQQIENIRNFMKGYGAWILSGVVIAAVGAGAWSYWQKQQHANNELHTATVQQLINDTQQADTTTALSGFAGTADKITQDAPHSVQAILAQLVIADQAYQREDYAAAEKALMQVNTSNVKDDGLLAVVNVRLANAQFAQDKFDEALATLAKVKVSAFTPTVEERKGDIFVAKQDIESAKKAYQTAWESLVQREEDSPILRMKLESVGVVVEDVSIPSPILVTALDTTTETQTVTQQQNEHSSTTVEKPAESTKKE